MYIVHARKIGEQFTIAYFFSHGQDLRKNVAFSAPTVVACARGF